MGDRQRRRKITCYFDKRMERDRREESARIENLEKLLKESLNVRDRLRDDLSKATHSLVHHAEVLQEMHEMKHERKRLEAELKHAYGEINSIVDTALKLQIPVNAQEKLGRDDKAKFICKFLKEAHRIFLSHAGFQQRCKLASVIILEQSMQKLLVRNYKSGIVKLRRSREEYVEVCIAIRNNFRTYALDKVKRRVFSSLLQTYFIAWAQESKGAVSALRLAFSASRRKDREVLELGFDAWNVALKNRRETDRGALRLGTIINKAVLHTYQETTILWILYVLRGVLGESRHMKKIFTDKFMRSGLLANKTAILTKSLSTWRDTVLNEKKMKDDRLARQAKTFAFIVGSNGLNLRVTFDAWVRRTENSKRDISACALMEKALKKACSRKIFTVFYFLIRVGMQNALGERKAAVEEQKERILTTLFGKASQAILQKIFHGWIQCVTESKNMNHASRQRRACALLLQESGSQMLLGAFFQNWVHVCKENKQKRIALTSLFRILNGVYARRKHYATRTWERCTLKMAICASTRHLNVVKDEMKKKLMGQFFFSYNQSKLTEVFKVWKDFYVRARAKRVHENQVSNHTQVCATLSATALLSQTFNAWREQYTCHSTGRSKLFYVLHRCHNRKIQSTFFHLAISALRATVKETRERDKRKRATALDASALNLLKIWRNDLLGCVMQSWTNAVRMSRTRRGASNQLFYALSRRMSDRLASTLGSWKVFNLNARFQNLAVQSNSSKSLMAKTMFSLKNAECIASIFREWKQLAAVGKQKLLSRGKLLKMFNSDANVLRLALRHWCEWVTRSRLMRPHLAMCVRAIGSATSRVMKARFSTWAKAAVMKRVKDQQGARLSRHSCLLQLTNHREQSMMLSMCLSKWRELARHMHTTGLQTAILSAQNTVAKRGAATLYAMQKVDVLKCWRAWVSVFTEARDERQRKEEKEREVLKIKKLFCSQEEKSFIASLRHSFDHWIRVSTHVRLERTLVALEEEKRTNKRQMESLKVLERNGDMLKLQNTKLTASCYKNTNNALQSFTNFFGKRNLKVYFTQWHHITKSLLIENLSERCAQTSCELEKVHQELRSRLQENDKKDRDIKALEDAEEWRRSRQVALAHGASTRLQQRKQWESLSAAFHRWAGPLGRHESHNREVQKMTAELKERNDRVSKLRTHMRCFSSSLRNSMDIEDCRGILHNWYRIVSMAHKERHAEALCTIRERDEAMRVQSTDHKRAQEHVEREHAFLRQKCQERIHQVGHRVTQDYVCEMLRWTFIGWQTLCRTKLRAAYAKEKKCRQQVATRVKPFAFVESALSGNFRTAPMKVAFSAWAKEYAREKEMRRRETQFVVRLVKSMEKLRRVYTRSAFEGWKAQRILVSWWEVIKKLKTECLRLRSQHSYGFTYILQKRTTAQNRKLLQKTYTEWRLVTLLSHRSNEIELYGKYSELHERLRVVPRNAVQLTYSSWYPLLLKSVVTVWRGMACVERESRRKGSDTRQAELRWDTCLLRFSQHLRQWMTISRKRRIFSYWARSSRISWTVQSSISDRKNRLQWPLNLWKLDTAVTLLMKERGSIHDRIAHRHHLVGEKSKYFKIWTQRIRSDKKMRHSEALVSRRDRNARIADRKFGSIISRQFFVLWAHRIRRQRAARIYERITQARFLTFVLFSWRLEARRKYANPIMPRTLLCERLRNLVHSKKRAVVSLLRAHITDGIRHELKAHHQSTMQEHERIVKDIDRSNLVHREYRDKFKRGREHLLKLMASVEQDASFHHLGAKYGGYLSNDPNIFSSLPALSNSEDEGVLLDRVNPKFLERTSDMYGTQSTIASVL